MKGKGFGTDRVADEIGILAADRMGEGRLRKQRRR